MSAVDQHAEAHRLRAEHGWGARRIGKELGITRYRAEQLLDKPLPEPGPTAEQPVAEPAEEVADRPSAAAEPVADEVAEVAEPVAVARLPRRVSAQRIEIDLRQNRALSRDLAELAELGLPAEALITQAVLVLKRAYRKGVERGDIRPGQRFVVPDMTVRPPLPAHFGPRRPQPAPPAVGG
ncbi:hypothetical protein [Streptomyces sp. NPDC018693]|uniref:hypothetical protein n=1 Tax=unclassified Streptomyces TaxID=2593676 RepID=UPI0037B1065A